GSSSYPATLPASNPATLPASHPAMPPASHPTTLPTSHPATLPASHPAMLPASHPAMLPASHPAMLPASFPATHPVSHPTTSPATPPTSHPAMLPASNPAMFPPGHPATYSYQPHPVFSHPPFMQQVPPTFHTAATTLGPATTASTFPSPFAPQQHPASPSRTTDSWITDPNWNTTQNHPSSWLASKLPRINLAPYDGDPRNWSYFIQNFKCLVHDVVPDDAQRIIFLKDYLSEKRRYGDPQLVVRAHVQSLIQLVGPKEGDFEALCVFSGAIQASVADLTNGGHLHDLLAPGLLYQVTSKLPPALMQKWGDEMCSLQPRAATLIDFDQWLESRVMAGTWAAPVLPPIPTVSRTRERAQRGKEEPKMPAVRHPRILHMSHRAPCVACSGPHQLEKCNKFSKLMPKARAELLLEKGGCFRCLHPGHNSKACEKKVACGQDNCKSYHHPMVHGAPRMFAPPKISQSDTPKTEPAAPAA
ncbi:Uncharacterized protein APZ42_008891, partial [Daphnia magna]